MEGRGGYYPVMRDAKTPSCGSMPRAARLQAVGRVTPVNYYLAMVMSSYTGKCRFR